jgi:hypothetical protein
MNHAAHLNDLAAVAEHVLTRSALPDDTPLDDVLLVVTTAAPSRASVCTRDAAVLAAMDVDALPDVIAEGITRFLTSALKQLNRRTRRDMIAALHVGAEPVVTFRPSLGVAKVIIRAAGHAPIELVTLRPAPAVAH